jgi:hypothetical protein
MIGYAPVLFATIPFGRIELTDANPTVHFSSSDFQMWAYGGATQAVLNAIDLPFHLVIDNVTVAEAVRPQGR